MRKKLLALSLVLFSGFSFAQTIQLTNGGSTTTTGTTNASPISAYFQFMRFQVVYTAAELNAAGITGPSTISQLGWYVSTAPASALPNYRIRMGNTSATNSAAHDATALTEVYNNASYAPTAGGFDMLTLNGSFSWDGTSNLLVDVCYGSAPYVAPYGQVRTYASTTASGCRSIRCDGCGSQCAVNTTTTNSFKPQVSLTFGSCLTPGLLAATPGTTSANLSWGSVSGASGYQWAVTTSATPPASGTATTATTATATGLTPATSHFLHVRTNCGGSFSSWNTFAFSTACTPTNIPYSQNFDGVTAPAIPTCITVQNVNGSNTWGNFSSPAAVLIGAPNSMVYAYNSTNPADDWFYLQGLNLTGGTTYRLTFRWKSNPNFPERFEVRYGPSASAAGMTSGTLYTNNNAASSAVVTEAIDFTPPSSGVYFIGFRCFSVADQDFLAIDDITVDLPPTCGVPTALSAIPTGVGTTANLSWTAPTLGTPTGYEWAITTTSTPPASGTAVAGTTATAGGLSATTAYFLHVRTDCGAAGFSNWATISFTTILNDECSGAITVTTQPNGANCVSPVSANTTGSTASIQTSSCWSTSLNDDIWYRFTATDTGVTINVSNFTATSGTATQLGFVIYNDSSSCSRVDAAHELTTACPTVNIVSGSGVANFNGLVVGNTYTLRLFAVGVSNSASFNFCLMDPPPPPTCVTNISPTNGATGIALTPNPTLSWNAATNATGYNVFFGTTNPPTVNIGTATGTSTSITGLAYNTTYFWYVQPTGASGNAAGCSANVYSFTTGNVPTNCVPLTSNGCGLSDRLELFRLIGETSELNINTGTTCTSSAYTDTTDHPVVINLARGKTYWGQAKAGATNDYITAWLDNNDNGIFENDERLLNNLPLATTSIRNINMFIPLSTPVGNHRLRVRLVWYSTAPTAPSDPCASYSYSDTKDFTVNVVAGGSPYTVATYPSSGSCYTGNGLITIDSASNNNSSSSFVPLVDSSNRIVAQLYPMGNNLGTVTSSYYKHNGPVRQDAGGRYYLDRNLTITVSRQPVTPYNLRFPYQNSELDALIAVPPSGVTSQFDLVMTKNGDACLNAIGTGGTGGAIFIPTGFGSISGDRFVDLSNITGGFSSFYLHGGGSPIPVNLVNFMVQRAGKMNNVSWSTSQEVNTSHFVVERSNDGTNFAEVGRVAANGNSNALLNYSFVDNNPVKGINYYRLRVVDRDNSAKFSAIRSVRNEGLADVSIFPNPVNNLLTVSIAADKAELGAITVTDMTGKIVLTRSISVAQGDNRMPVNTAALASGTYIIKVQLNNDMVVRKFNKQ